MNDTHFRDRPLDCLCCYPHGVVEMLSAPAVSLVCALVLLVGGCAVQSRSPDATPAPVLPSSAATAQHVHRSLPAVIALQEEAAKSLDVEDALQANRLLERALRLDARDPNTYYWMARVRMAEQAPSRALPLIEKSLSLRPADALRDRLLDLQRAAEAAR